MRPPAEHSRPPAAAPPPAAVPRPACHGRRTQGESGAGLKAQAHYMDHKPAELPAYDACAAAWLNGVDGGPTSHHTEHGKRRSMTHQGWFSSVCSGIDQRGAPVALMSARAAARRSGGPALRRAARLPAARRNAPPAPLHASWLRHARPEPVTSMRCCLIGQVWLSCWSCGSYMCVTSALRGY